MSLTMGSAPLSRQPGGVFNTRLEGAGRVIYFEPFPRRIRAQLGGRTVIDTVRGQLLFESGLPAVLYVPEGDVRQDLIERTDLSTHCPFKGDAAYWTVSAGGKTAPNALWAYLEPIDNAGFLRGFVAPEWDAFDAWFEEDEQLHTRLRDPYHRIDVRRAAARVTVRVDGQTVAESTRPRLLFETGLPVRAYLPREDVRDDLLNRTDTSSVCPYKGIASYWSVGDRVDVAWSYHEPIPEAGAIDGLVSFLGDGVEVEIDRSTG